MIKSWNEFIREFVENSESVIDAKMGELNDLISNLSDGNNIMYQWENKDNSELIINFLFNDLSIRYELKIKDLKITKVVGESIDFSIEISSIDEALDIIEKDIHNILGISENYRSNWDSSIKRSEVLPIIDKIVSISNLSIADSEPDIEGLIENLMNSLSIYDQIVVDEVIDLMLFNYPYVGKEYIINKIIELGDRVFEKEGTEPSMVLRAFEDAFNELSNHYYISEKKKPGRPKAGRTKSGRKVPGKYLTKNRKLMKKEIEEFQGKDTYKKDWDADYKSGKGGQGKRHQTKKSAATKAYQKMFGNK
jgi:hypothetical protein